MRWTRVAVLLLAAACRQPGVPAEGPARAGAPAPFGMGRPDVVLLVSSDTRGLFEPCYCAGQMYGGLSRRKGLVDAYRAAHPRTVLIDAGDSLRVSAHGDPRNEYLLEGYRRIGYDAVVLGVQEWLTPGLAELVAPGGTAFLATTVSDRRQQLPVARELRRRWGPVRLAVLAWMPPDPALLPKGRIETLGIEGVEAVRARAAALREEGYAVVLVVNGLDDAVASAARTCAPDLLVQGHFPAARASVDRVAGVPAARTGGYDYVSAFALRMDGGRVREVEHRFERVDDRWPADAALGETYRASLRAGREHALEAKRDVGLRYVGSKACGECHAAEYEAWRRHPHARAFATLEAADRAGDADCLGCHTSGFESERGFYSTAKTPELANVNCQDCHEIELDPHREDGKAPPVTEASCRRCHTAKTDPHFDFAKRRGQGGCVGAH